jgi:hypothetical protein
VGLEIPDYGLGDPPRFPLDTPLSSKVGTNFADKQRSVGIVPRGLRPRSFFVKDVKGRGCGLFRDVFLEFDDCGLKKTTSLCVACFLTNVRT